MFAKIVKMAGATILLLVAVQYLVSLCTALIVFVVALLSGTNLVDNSNLYNELHALSIIISFALIVYLWIKGYKSIFKKIIKKEETILIK